MKYQVCQPVFHKGLSTYLFTRSSDPHFTPFCFSCASLKGICELTHSKIAPQQTFLPQIGRSLVTPLLETKQYAFTLLIDGTGRNAPSGMTAGTGNLLHDRAQGSRRAKARQRSPAEHVDGHTGLHGFQHCHLNARLQKRERIARPAVDQLNLHIAKTWNVNCQH
jgi:hypothetical protein